MNDQEMLAEVRACNKRLVEELIELQAEYVQLQKAYNGLLNGCGPDPRAFDAEDEPEAPVDPLIPPQDWKGAPA